MKKYLINLGFLTLILSSYSKDALISKLDWIEWQRNKTDRLNLLAFPGAEGFGRFKYLIPQHHKQEI
ncbi:hypothetical protein HX021_04545 [Sphingobacterium sp. N143]|uniref:hypothetical protein n=1 Tax=Sphingobacterium sp. N143 TaxID=2746727 RepID=UPI002578838B|nr:hypothetical protein [Sphingobacterium sp. N143]MDM1293562.1 hypothetical protein [Sphingobacterium sp. N143]